MFWQSFYSRSISFCANSATSISLCTFFSPKESQVVDCSLPSGTSKRPPDRWHNLP